MALRTRLAATEQAQAGQRMGSQWPRLLTPREAAVPRASVPLKFVEPFNETRSEAPIERARLVTVPVAWDEEPVACRSCINSERQGQCNVDPGRRLQCSTCRDEGNTKCIVDESEGVAKRMNPRPLQDVCFVQNHPPKT